MLSLSLMRDQLDPYNTTQLQLNRSHTTELCSGPVCCQFSVETEVIQPPNDTVHYKYRLAAFDGVRTFSGKADGGIKVCALFACIDDTLVSCGKR